MRSDFEEVQVVSALHDHHWLGSKGETGERATCSLVRARRRSSRVRASELKAGQRRRRARVCVRHPHSLFLAGPFVTLRRVGLFHVRL